MDISVVIPLYNEDESLPELVAWIERVMNAQRVKQREGARFAVFVEHDRYPLRKSIRPEPLVWGQTLFIIRLLQLFCKARSDIAYRKERGSSFLSCASRDRREKTPGKAGVFGCDGAAEGDWLGKKLFA